MYIPPDPASLPVATPLTSPTTLAGTGEPKWKQILTRGFPTYRCQAQLTSDPDTGKTYLFGGFTNHDFVPGRKDYNTKSFGDVWQLRIDEPGGCFEGVDLEEETRTAKAGPWQRCFSCGDAGPWKKCGGPSSSCVIIPLQILTDRCRDLQRTGLLLWPGMPQGRVEGAQENTQMSKAKLMATNVVMLVI